MVKRNSFVTVVDNKTGKEMSGYLVQYTKDTVIINTNVTFDAKEVHFKETK